MDSKDYSKMKKTKIVHVTPKYFPNQGGVETLTKEICERLYSRGFNTIIYSLDFNDQMPKQEIINGVLVKRYRPIIEDPFFLPPPSFFIDLRNEKAAILHVHNIQNIFPLFVSLFKKVNQRVILHPHYHKYGQTFSRNLLLQMYKPIISKLVIGNAKKIIANSRYEFEILNEDFRTNKIQIINQGLDVAELKDVKWNPIYPERILYVGALKKYKKVDRILKAFKILLNDKHEGTKLVLVGSGPDKTHLIKLGMKLGLNKNIEWKQNLNRNELLIEYSRARVVILLSNLESFSRVINEALVIGIPTIVSKTGAFANFQNPLITKVNSNDPKEISEAISQVFQTANNNRDFNTIELNNVDQYVNQIAAIYLTFTN